MKKQLVALLCLVACFALLLNACSSGTEGGQSGQSNGNGSSDSTSATSTASETPTIDAIKAKGTLVLGTESTYPPFEFMVMKDGKSVNVGMDVDLAQKIADALGVELVVSEMAFDSLIPSLQSGSIDLAGSMTPSEKRLQQVDFSELYYTSTNCFVMLKEEAANFTTKESFDGKTIGAQMGTLQNELVTQEMTNAKSLILPKVTTLIQEIKSGNIDAICCEAPVADVYVAAFKDELAKAPFEIPDEGGGVGLTMKKGSDDLKAFIDEMIKEMNENGEMEELYQNNVELAISTIGDDE